MLEQIVRSHEPKSRQQASCLRLGIAGTISRAIITEARCGSTLDCRFAASFASAPRLIESPVERFLLKALDYFDFKVARADAQSAARNTLS
jgi:hypothetical protein